jgi:uncharacterized protein YprB with RNaseH-like and TPR domain
MSSSLQRKLNAIKSTLPALSPAEKLARESGVIVYAHEESAPDDFRDQSSEALRRIGWSGRAFDIEDCLFLDTETTGLSHGAGTIAFLIGVGWIENGVMRVEQFFARDYPDEAATLLRLRDIMQNKKCAITFNGRSFDLPLLRTRFAFNRLGDMPELYDLDLLPPSRRVWKLRIESCRLSNIEERILGIAREGDIPGGEVPRRYFDYLKTGDFSLIDDVITHNRQDIITLAHLLKTLLRVYREPEAAEHRQDLFSLGRALEAQGESARARELYRLSAQPDNAQPDIAALANLRLYRLCLRADDVVGAITALDSVVATGLALDTAHVELSKIYEHRLKQYDLALAHARLAMQLPYSPPDLRKREERLIAKLTRKAD